MRILNLESNQVFRPAIDGEYELSFIPDLKSGKNFRVYAMHWIRTDRLEPFLCLGFDCPICTVANRVADYREWRAKTRVVLNIWKDDDTKPKIWDVNLFLLSQGLGTIPTTDPRLFDESKFGLTLSLTVRRRGPGFPEYRISNRLRRFEIPPNIIRQTYDLNELITMPDRSAIVRVLDEALNSGPKREAQITEIVGEVFTGKRTVPVFEQTVMVGKKKKKYQEPEPYKRVRRVIIMDEE